MIIPELLIPTGLRYGFLIPPAQVLSLQGIFVGSDSSLEYLGVYLVVSQRGYPFPEMGEQAAASNS